MVLNFIPTGIVSFLVDFIAMKGCLFTNGLALNLLVGNDSFDKDLFREPESFLL